LELNESFQNSAMDNNLLQKIPNSLAGQQIRWYLDRLLCEGNGASPEDRAHYTPELRRRLYGVSEPDERARWRSIAARLGRITNFTIEYATEFALRALLTTTKGHQWWLMLEVEAKSPHLIAKLDWQRQVDFKLEVRKATEADAAALAEIERRCPIVLGDTSIYFDRGDDYFAFTRLMEEATVGIALVDDKPAAATCAAMHKVMIGGVIRPIVTVAHLRVMPEHQRKGLWGAVNRAFDHYWKDVDGSNAFISVRNEGMQHGFSNTPNKWPVSALCVHLACNDLAGPTIGRLAAASDAARVVEILNATHESEEMYVPYTVATLTARLERAPKQYSWQHLWMTDHAVVGVWPAGDSLCVIKESKHDRVVSRRGLTLDYGFFEGAEDEFEGLLKAWCATLATDKIDTLSIFTSEQSAGCARICQLGREIEAFNMWSPGIPVPADSQLRGLYVDPIYF
jgi:hypothetical protein